MIGELKPTVPSSGAFGLKANKKMSTIKLALLLDILTRKLQQIADIVKLFFSLHPADINQLLPSSCTQPCFPSGAPTSEPTRSFCTGSHINPSLTLTRSGKSSHVDISHFANADCFFFHKYASL